MSYKNSKAKFKELKKNVFKDDFEDYGLSTKEEIEAKFNEFSQEKQLKFQVSDFLSPFERNKTMLSDGSPKATNLENLTSNKSLNAITIAKDLDNNNQQKVSNWTDSNESITNFAREFNINTAPLSQFKTKDEKIKYIVECLRENLATEYEEYLKKSSSRKQQIEDFEKNYKKSKKKYAKEKIDVFGWLAVNSPFESLRKRLGGKIVETIIDYENLTKVEKGLEEIKTTTSSFDATTKTAKTTSRAKIQLDNIPRVNNSELLMDFAGNSEFSTKASARELTRTFSKMTSPRSVQSARNPGKRLIIYNRETNDEEKEEEEKIEKALLEKNAWNEDKEKIFFDYRYEAKKRLYNNIKSSDFNGVGFSPLVQSTQTDAKSKLQRDMKLAKYMNGDPLTPQECKFLATTSRSLNRHVDKELIQNTLKYLDPSVIDAIEIDLAQNILSDYQKVRKQLTAARHEYLQNENITKIEDVSHADKKFKKHRKIKEAAQSQELLKQKVNVYIKQAEDLRAKEGSSLYTHNHQTNFDANKVRENTSFIKSFTGVVHPTPKSEMDTKMAKHLYHPPSKLLVNTEEHQRDLLGLPGIMVDQMVKKRPNEHPNNLKLRIDESPAYKNPNNFIRYLSGGPSEEFDESFTQTLKNGQMEFGITREQENTLVKIQSLWRGLKERENFKLLRDLHIEELVIRDKLEQMKNEPGFSLQEAEKKLKKKLRLKNDDYDEYEEKERKRKIKLFEQLDLQYERLFGKRPRGAEKKKTIITSATRLPMQSMILDQAKEFQKNKSVFEEKPDTTQKTQASPKQTIRKFMPKSIITMRPNTAVHRSLRKFDSYFDDNEDGNDQDVEKKVESTKSSQYGLLVKHQKLLAFARKNEKDISLLAGYKFTENDVNTKDENGNTPLYYASRWGNKEFCEYLLGLKARCNQRCQDGNTPLHMAFSSNKMMIVILMIQHGGNLNILNDAGQTPVAFGSGALLQSLDLTHAVATYDGANDHHLPPNLDNHRFLAKSPKSQNLDRADFKFNPINRNTLEIKSRDNQLHSYAI